MMPDSPPSADTTDMRQATSGDEQDAPWGDCEILLVAHRTRGATHKFFHDRRFEVVMSAGQPVAGTTLFAVQPSPQEIAASGWRYELSMLEERPSPLCPGRTVFSWRATNAPTTPDPLAAALEQTRVWLGAAGWQQDPTHPTHYHLPRPATIRPPAIGSP